MLRTRVPTTKVGDVAGAAIGIALVTACTAANHVGLLPTQALAATPHRVAEGRLWLLVSNGVLVQRPVVVSLASFAILACIGATTCGVRMLYGVGAIGHVAGTLLAYAFAATAVLVDPHGLGASANTLDYGVSAIQAAWIGATVATLWPRTTNRYRRAAIVLGCIAIFWFAIAMRRHITILDSDHIFAFAIGIVITQVFQRRRVATPVASAAT